MPLKMTRRRFAQLSAAAGASVWVRPVFGETHAAAEWVNPLIGASTSQKLGEGKTFPGPTTPFGLVQLSPDTVTGGDNAPGYSYEHTTIEGFSFTHMSGVGWYGDFGNLLTMATTGSLRFAAGRPLHPDEGWRSQFACRNTALYRFRNLRSPIFWWTCRVVLEEPPRVNMSESSALRSVPRVSYNALA
jgi:putative alpha-1,2-mannosidase